MRRRRRRATQLAIGAGSCQAMPLPCAVTCPVAAVHEIALVQDDDVGKLHLSKVAGAVQGYTGFMVEQKGGRAVVVSRQRLL